MTFDDLTRLDNRALEPLMATGTVPTVSDVTGFEFRGWNNQASTEILGTRKFFKGFYAAADAGVGKAWGYNMPAVQNGRDQPWQDKTKQGQPVRYYYFKVLPGSALSDAIYPKSLVVDYRQFPKYSIFNPIRYTVDYLVFPHPANRDLILGKSYSQLGFIKPFLGFFILERFRASGLGGGAG